LQNATLAKWLGLAAVLVVLDQLVKLVVVRSLELGERIPVLPFFSWVRWHNTGAAFSMLNDLGGWQRWLFVALALGFSGFLLYELRRLAEGERLQAFVYALILGGALGNMIDRLRTGYVVDYVLVHYQEWYFPAFNLADSALSVGAVLWILLLLREGKRERAA
jgi:signal peptidase II